MGLEEGSQQKALAKSKATCIGMGIKGKGTPPATAFWTFGRRIMHTASPAGGPLSA
jgi:hypothetical protein